MISPYYSITLFTQHFPSTIVALFPLFFIKITRVNIYNSVLCYFILAVLKLKIPTF